jgi:NAD(P)H-hydrate epimerase
MARLLGVPIEDVLEDRVSAVRACADRYAAHVLLKGHRTLLASPDGTLRVNPTGNPGLASGGTGDVLTGVVAGFLAAGLEADAALALAAFLHGLAADRAVELLGETSLVATDLLDFLPEVIQDAVEGDLEEWEEDWEEEGP